MSPLVEKCKESKAEKGLTNQQLADLSGLPKGTVDSFFRTSNRSPTIDTVGAICAALGVSMDAFFGIRLPSEGAETAEEKQENCESAAEFLERQLSDIAGDNKTLQAQLRLQREIIDKQNHGIRMRDHIMIHFVIVLLVLLGWCLYLDAHCVDFGFFR